MKSNNIKSIYDYPFTIETEYNFNIRLMNWYLFTYGSSHSKEYRTYNIKIRINKKLHIDVVKQYLQKAYQDFNGITDDECMINMLKWWMLKYYPKYDWIMTIGNEIILPSFGDRYGAQFVYRYDIQQKSLIQKDFPLYCTFCGNDFLNEEKAKFYMCDKDSDEYDDDYPGEEQEDYFYRYECPVCGVGDQLEENIYRKFYFYVNGTDYEEDETRKYEMGKNMRPSTLAYQHKNSSCIV